MTNRFDKNVSRNNFYREKTRWIIYCCEHKFKNVTKLPFGIYFEIHCYNFFKRLNSRLRGDPYPPSSGKYKWGDNVCIYQFTSVTCYMFKYIIQRKPVTGNADKAFKIMSVRLKWTLLLTRLWSSKVRETLFVSFLLLPE